MAWWQLNADTLARSRFVVSPLAEVIAGLKTLQHGRATHPVDRVWVDTHLPAHLARMADDAVTALLLAAALQRYWNAEFLTPTPTGESDFEAELAHIRATPPSTVRRDLLVSLNGPLPTALDRADLATRTADLLSWVWRTTVEPTWPRRRRVIEADIAARTARLTRGGWAAALEGMRPGMQLVALTGQGLGSVGRHLRVLLDGALVGRRRAGGSVLYHRTHVGERLVVAQSPTDP